MDTHKRQHTFIGRLTALLAMTALTLVAGRAGAIVNSGVSSANFASTPPTVTETVDPLVMLTISNDHQLYVKAYNDYSNLDDDAQLETTYKDTFDYYGYFDSGKCYEYSGGVYVPLSAAVGANGHHCEGAGWSGNFMNWSAMTRMDVMRRVLFGGKRSTDTTAATVLERAYLPPDAHAYVKVFAPVGGAAVISEYIPSAVVGLNNEISMCNVTWNTTSTESQNITSPPLIRLAAGSWPGWSANEVIQCAFRDERDGGLGIEPPAANKIADYTARIQVCVAGSLEENCKVYPNSGSPIGKPTGLLQFYGTGGVGSIVKFGLITGSYNKPRSGGVLRRDISRLTGNATASENEINTTTGQFINQDPNDEGIINALSRMRISQYEFTDYDDCDAPGIPKSSLGSSGTTECSMWGNPLSEMYLEALRYFSGLTSPTAAFDTSDAGHIPSLPQISTWEDPMDVDEYCATCNIIVISTGLNSFDTDELGTASDINGMAGAGDVNTATNDVGTLEGVNGNDYFIGDNGTTDDDQCTAKTVNNLADAEGICPEIPFLDGGYQIAGLAYYGHITDLRPAGWANGPRTDDQKVTTYSVSLAESVPTFDIPVGGSTVRLIPNCKARSNTAAGTPYRQCSLVDVQIDVTAEDGDGNPTAAVLLIHWEDSAWGNDYDMDAVQRLEFSVGGSDITVSTSVVQSQLGHLITPGYIISGTTSDGVYDGDEVTGTTTNLYPVYVAVPGDITTNVHTQGASAANVLPNPLWLAAKYGGFNDINGNDQPDAGEWDVRDLNGNATPDGIPDNYFPVTNPAQLEARLGSVLSSITDKVAAGTAAAVVSNTSTGVGALYQALYQPTVKRDNNEATWVGYVHALFIDDRGYLREDTDGDALLDGYTTDRIVDVYYDEVAGQTLVQRYTSSDGGVTLTADGAPVPITSMNTIWNAQDQLSALDNDTIQNNRTYTSSADNGRYITTWIDANADGVIDDGEVQPFVAGTFTSGDVYRYLNVADGTAATRVVNYVRGKEGLFGTRNRTVDYDDDGDLDVLRLGDIIHSTPIVVGRPKDQYDTRYGDESYAEFKALYANRRQVVYVGANDGMIHAFNGGFWDTATKSFITDNGSDTDHPLGAELWAYAPGNLLPHMKWLPELDYPHVYYMDGEPVVRDVNIFPEDDVHLHGWGTILIIGMRLGGGPIPYDVDGAAGFERTSRSAYVVLDITNPESAPTLMAEYTAPAMGFTTSRPDIIANRIPTDGDWFNPSNNEWYGIAGSGPTNLQQVSSNQAPLLYLMDLTDLSLLAGSAAVGAALGISNSFFGDIKVKDWNDNFIPDNIYFGSVGGDYSGDPTTETGGMHSWMIEPGGGGGPLFRTLLDAGQPISKAPSLSVDENGDRWVHFGTGRVYTGLDMIQEHQESMYGVKEPRDASGNYTHGTVLKANLQNITGIEVFSDSTLNVPGGLGIPVAVDTYAELDNYIEENKDGWYRNHYVNAGDPSGRVVTEPVRISTLLLYTDFIPSEDRCDALGVSNLYAVSFKTGTAYPFGALGFDTTSYPGSELALDNIEFAKGLVSSIVIHQGAETDGVTVIGQSSTGALPSEVVKLPPTRTGRQSWREITKFY